MTIPDPQLVAAIAEALHGGDGYRQRYLYDVHFHNQVELLVATVADYYAKAGMVVVSQDEWQRAIDDKSDVGHAVVGAWMEKCRSVEAERDEAIGLLREAEQWVRLLYARNPDHDTFDWLCRVDTFLANHDTHTTGARE